MTPLESVIFSADVYEFPTSSTVFLIFLSLFIVLLAGCLLQIYLLVKTERAQYLQFKQEHKQETGSWSVPTTITPSPNPRSNSALPSSVPQVHVTMPSMSFESSIMNEYRQLERQIMSPIEIPTEVKPWEKPDYRRQSVIIAEERLPRLMSQMRKTTVFREPFVASKFLA